MVYSSTRVRKTKSSRATPTACMPEYTVLCYTDDCGVSSIELSVYSVCAVLSRKPNWGRLSICIIRILSPQINSKRVVVDGNLEFNIACDRSVITSAQCILQRR